MNFEFQPWPKTPRLNREMVITEKIDGTNAAILVGDSGSVAAQSRKRLITPGDDNFGFARWVWDNADALADRLGPGYHYGEWWGSGIQRGYGLPKGEKRFSLFNTHRWADLPYDDNPIPGLTVVPVLFEGLFDSYNVDDVVDGLALRGSFAAPGFMDPEGVVVFHKAANQCFKVTIKDDEIPKELVA